MLHCYVCYEDNTTSPFMNSSPCKCKGSMQIHITCYESIRGKMHKCPICKEKYPLQYVNGLARVVYRIKGYRYEYTVDETQNIQGVFNVYDESDDSYIYESRNYINNEIVGYTYGYYPNGSIEYITPYINNKKYGNKIYYYICGSIKRITPYVDNVIHGVEYSYTPLQTVESIVPYINDTIHGRVYKYKYDHVTSTNKIKHIIPYDLGVKHGTVYSFSITGHLEAVVNYMNGMIHGACNTYYDNCKLRERLYYKHNKRHGQHVIYYNNGVVRKKVYWDSGRRVKHAPATTPTHHTLIVSPAK